VRAGMRLYVVTRQRSLRNGVIDSIINTAAHVETVLFDGVQVNVRLVGR
jgi:hypothetical protein